MKEVKVNKKYKDRLFRLVFEDKKDLLDLYNAVSGKQYENLEDLEITTLEDAVYMKMKNDISFLVSDILNLYEHQSSFTPNMPLRGFHYFSDEYRQLVEAEQMNIYGGKLLKLPMPQYVVFYNGTKEEPDRLELKLSDAFICDDPEVKPCLECRATMLNINHGHNLVLMEKCKRLGDYALFVERVRKNQAEGKTLNEAVDLASSSCIGEGILSDILSKNRAEVCNLILYEYDEQKQMAIERNEAKAEGFAEGKAKGRAEGEAKGREEGEAKGREEGKASVVISMIRRKLDRGLDSSAIAAELELEEGYVKQVLAVLSEDAGRTDLEAARMLMLDEG